MMMALLLAASVASLSPQPAAPRWVTPAVQAPRLQQRTFDSAAARTKVSYFIHTPELYDAHPDRRFPVLYWLHGSGGGLSGVPVLVAQFEAAIRSGMAPPMIVVFANGLEESLWCDSKDGSVPMETVVVKELVKEVDATFRTIAARGGRLIEGFSMGGYGAARLGFNHPRLFGAVSILAGAPLQRDFDRTPRATPLEREKVFQAVFGGDPAYFRRQSPWELAERNAGAVRGGTRVRQIIGDRDETLDFNREFHEHLTRLRIPHTFTVLPGVGHDPRAVLEAMGKARWDFYREAFDSRPSGARQGRPGGGEPARETDRMQGVRQDGER